MKSIVVIWYSGQTAIPGKLPKWLLTVFMQIWRALKRKMTIPALMMRW